METGIFFFSPRLENSNHSWSVIHPISRRISAELLVNSTKEQSFPSEHSIDRGCSRDFRWLLLTVAAGEQL